MEGIKAQNLEKLVLLISRTQVFWNVDSSGKPTKTLNQQWQQPVARGDVNLLKMLFLGCMSHISSAQYPLWLVAPISDNDNTESVHGRRKYYWTVMVKSLPPGQ